MIADADATAHTQPMPRRVRRTRPSKKGALGMPRSALYVGRGSKWGNPWRVTYNRRLNEYFVAHTTEDRIAGGFPDEAGARRCATWSYRRHLAEHPELIAALGELRGRDLACWCRLPDPGESDDCHATVLIELAAQTEPTSLENNHHGP